MKKVLCVMLMCMSYNSLSGMNPEPNFGTTPASTQELFKAIDSLTKIRDKKELLQRSLANFILQGKEADLASSLRIATSIMPLENRKLGFKIDDSFLSENDIEVTLLLLAIWYAKDDAIALLLLNVFKASPNVFIQLPSHEFGRQDSLFERSPLELAVEKERLSIVKALVNKGADVTVRGAPEQRTVLHRKLYGMHSHSSPQRLDILRFLLDETKIDMNVLNSRKRTPLMGAASQGDVAYARILLDHGAEIMLTDQYGRTAVDEARRGGQKEFLDFLQKYTTERVTTYAKGIEAGTQLPTVLAGLIQEYSEIDRFKKEKAYVDRQMVKIQLHAFKNIHLSSELLSASATELVSQSTANQKEIFEAVAQFDAALGNKVETKILVGILDSKPMVFNRVVTLQNHMKKLATA